MCRVRSQCHKDCAGLNCCCPSGHNNASIFCPDIDPHRVALSSNQDCVNGYALNVALNNTVKVNSQYAQGGRLLSEVRYPSLTYAITEARAGYICIAGTDDSKWFSGGMYLKEYLPLLASEPFGANRHFDKSNYLFVDGHVKTHSSDEFWIHVESDGSTLTILP